MQQQSKETGIGRRFTCAAPAQEVTHATRARTATTATTAQNKAGRAVSADRGMKYWEIIEGKLRKAGWRCGCIASTNQKGRAIWVAAAERNGVGRFIVYSDEMPTAFL